MNFPRSLIICCLIMFVSICDLLAATLYVNVNGSSPVAPYAYEFAAAIDLQSAVDASSDGDTIIVADGTYYPTSQIVITNAINIVSENGPKYTIIDGGGKNRCFYMKTELCEIHGLTIKNGFSQDEGGGIGCEIYIDALGSTHFIGGLVEGCVFTGNQAYEGGGMCGGTVSNCTFVGNTGFAYGGGVARASAYRCTLVGNNAVYGGGVFQSSTSHCIWWYNMSESGSGYFSGDGDYFDCAPLSSYGSVGCITNNPMFVSSSHIAVNSPCIGAGSVEYAAGVDLDGDPWKTPPAIGRDEPNNVPDGDIQLDIVGLPSNIITGCSVECVALVVGQVSRFTLDLGDGIILTNDLHRIEKSWNTAGVYDVVLTAYNNDFPSGLSHVQRVTIGDFEDIAVHVSPDGDDANNGESWAKAKATIQAALDAQESSYRSVLVSNGIYALDAEIILLKGDVVKSINGPEHTIVDGGSRNRCFNIYGTKCQVEGFTIQNGLADSGGGVSCLNYIDPLGNTHLFGDGTASDCVFVGNTANYGGGMCYGTAGNCLFINNKAEDGGGMYGGVANTCVFTGNDAEYGGGICGGGANNCTFTYNTADYGGGICSGGANNCIVWHNMAMKEMDDIYDHLGRQLGMNTCSPDVIHGASGCITNDPMLVSNSHISTNSPCVGVGNSFYLKSGADIDGDQWSSPPSMGCDEPNESCHGHLSVGLSGLPSIVADNYIVNCGVQVVGPSSLFTVDFDNGVVMTNLLGIVQNSWMQPGEYDVVLTAYNDDYPTGVSFTNHVSVVTRESLAVYVAPDGNDENSGENWADAKATIQAGVDAVPGVVAGACVWVSNGTYNLTSEILVDKDIGIQSLNGAGATVIDGGGVTRCLNLGDSQSSINGFTIRNGYTGGSGGGVYCSNRDPVLNNCAVIGNTAGYRAGGMYCGTANNCTITFNTASEYPGVCYGKANNCVVWYNESSSGVNSNHGTLFSYSCAPEVNHGENGCITNLPMMTSSSHLSISSPCVSAGSAEYISGFDIDGDQWRTPPSMGCDEPGGALNGPIEIAIIEWHPTVPVDYEVEYGVQVSGAVFMFYLDFGNGCVITNSLQPETVSWHELGEYRVVLSAFNDDYPLGISITQQVNVIAHDEVMIYVAPDGDDSNDGLSWETSKATIQAGIDAPLLFCNEVVVSNGYYSLSSEIIIDHAVNVRSLNGADVTIVDGRDRNRCFNLGSAACVIDGFTITNGYSSEGGGVYCSSLVPVVSNCVVIGNTGYYGGGITRGTAHNCTISGNTGYYGGGMRHGIAYNCIISGNTGGQDGGIAGGTVYNCTISGNIGGHTGGVGSGAAYNCIISGNTGGNSGGISKTDAINCVISGNTGKLGGGMNGCTAYNCIISGNTAECGGGTYYVNAINCEIINNHAFVYGGGLFNGTAKNCSICRNTSGDDGGGIYNVEAINSIIWFNTTLSSGYNTWNSSLFYCCSPDLDMTQGNITNNPIFRDSANGDFYLLAESPCIDAGNNDHVSADFDLDGVPRILDGDADGIATVDMGCYEFFNSFGDSDGDLMTDQWELNHGLNMLVADGNSNRDNDPFSNVDEFIADTDPNSSNDWFCVTAISNAVLPIVFFNSSSNRLYTLLGCTNLFEGVWGNLLGPRTGIGGPDSFDTISTGDKMFYKLGVDLP